MNKMGPKLYDSEVVPWTFKAGLIGLNLLFKIMGQKMWKQMCQIDLYETTLIVALFYYYLIANTLTLMGDYDMSNESISENTCCTYTISNVNGCIESLYFAWINDA